MASRLRWTGVRFRDPDSGRFITRRAVQRALDDSLLNVRRLTDSLAADLRSGRISLMEWREGMREAIKFTQMAARELAVGGRAQMTPADYGRAGQEIRRQYQYLEGWVQQMARGEVQAGDEGRAALYLRSARSAFIRYDTEALQASGFDQIRTKLHVAEHCAECIAEAARGFVPIGAHTPIGQRQCRDNDRCTAEFRNSRTGEILAA